MMSVSQTWVNSDGTFGNQEVRIICFACKHIATSVEDHNAHLANANHADMGETYR